MLTTLVAVAVILGGLILVHELGHFWAAKAVDIEVPRFSIGLGPKMVGIQRGETEYVISWLPLGGYVKMAGMDEEEALEGLEGEASPEDREPSDRDFDAKPVWARGLVLSAGVGMNFLFAVVAFGLISATWGIAPEREPRIGSVAEEELPPEALALGRLEPGTLVTAVNGDAVDSFDDLRMSLATASAGPATLGLEDGRTVAFRVPDDEEGRNGLASALGPGGTEPVEPIIGEVLEDSPADSAGLRAGDLVLTLDGRPVESWQAFAAGVERRPGEDVTLEVLRDSTRRSLVVRPEVNVLASDRDTLRYGRVGVRAERDALEAALAGTGRRLGPLAAVAYGVDRTWEWTVRTLEIVGRMVTGSMSTGNLAGPVRIAEMSGDVARMGPVAFLNFMAILSVNLAILNLLPIPVLDGGQLMFLGIEAVRGRAVSTETRIRWAQVGVVLVAALMLWAIGNDLLHIFG